ncbi:hypothetical protein ES703_64521 [subsurface metagenome]
MIADLIDNLHCFSAGSRVRESSAVLGLYQGGFFFEIIDLLQIALEQITPGERPLNLNFQKAILKH